MSTKTILPWSQLRCCSAMQPARSVLLLPLGIMLTGQIFAKLSGTIIESGGSIVNIYSFLSYTCLIGRGFLWIFIIRRMRLVFAYPVMSLNYILVLLVSHFFFHEEIISTNLLGAGFITAGVVLIGLGENRTRKVAYPSSKRSARPGKIV